MYKRDIRDDLNERLASIEQERERLVSRLESLATAKAGIEVLLEGEVTHFTDEQYYPLFLAAPSNINDFVMQQLRKGGNWTVEELKQEAARMGFHFGDKKPGRVIHFLLVALKRGGTVQQEPNGKWCLSEQ